MRILSFPSPERIQSLWPAHFSTVAAAKAFVNNPQALAEEVYKGRFGNTDPGDGWRYRGRGMAMLLGREEYARYRQIVGLDLIANPDLVLIPAVGARVAFEAYFPASTISEISEIFLKNPGNWQGAIGAVHRVFEKDGIETKSKVLYDCINNAVIPKRAG
jgi:predicted chitinase